MIYEHCATEALLKSNRVVAALNERADMHIVHTDDTQTVVWVDALEGERMDINHGEQAYEEDEESEEEHSEGRQSSPSLPAP